MHVIHIWKAMSLSYNLAYQEIILVHPTRRQIFAGYHTLLSGTSENESYIVVVVVVQIQVKRWRL